MKGIFAGVAFVVLGSLMGATAHAVTIVLPRAGQVGIGLQGQYGGLTQSGVIGDEFGTGGGMAVRLKYRTRFERAAGLSFETQRLDGRGQLVPRSEFPTGIDSLPLASLTLQTYGVDLYQFFGSRTRTPRYLSASGGLAKINAWGRDGDPVYPFAPDGVFLSVGAGLERFVYRSWAVDLSARYSAIFIDGTTNHDVQVALGMILYAAY